MKSNLKHVLELVIVRFNQGNQELALLADLGQSGHDSLIRTHVRVENHVALDWVLDGLNKRVWGLASKSRYYLLDWTKSELDVQTGADRCLYPLYRRASSLSQAWVINPEIIRLFN